LVAGGVAVAAAKISGKSWKESFKGAIKPALAGAAGAVVGKLAADFVANMGSGAKPAAAAQGGGDIEAAQAADNKTIGALQSKYPPDKYEFQGQGERLTVIDRSTGEPVQTFSGLKGQTMDTATLADLANNPNQAAASAAQPVAAARSNNPTAAVQPAQAAAASEVDATGMGDDSDYAPVDTGSLRQGQQGLVQQTKDFAAGGTVPPEQAGQETPKFRPRVKPQMQIDPNYVPQDTNAPVPPGTTNPETGERYTPRRKTNASREYQGNRLTEGQCYLIMKRVAQTNRDMIVEGYLVLEAGMLQKAGSWLKTKAQNITQQVTADKLMQAWKKAQSPMDSNAVAKVMADAGVNPDVIKKVYTDMKLPEPGAEGTADQVDYKTLSAEIMKLPVDTKVQIVNYMKNELKVA